MTQEIIVVGAGGHAKVCIELLQAMGERVAYCVGGDDSQEHCLGIPVLKGDDNLEELNRKGYKRVFIAIGANRLRDRLAALTSGLGYTLVNAISPSASISPSAKIGSGVAIMAGAVINSEANIGDLSIVNTGATIDHDCRIGRAVHIAPQSALAGNVVVGDYAFLGIGTKVIPEVVIGELAIIGAGGVVVGDISPRVTAVGVPARQIK
ncbi:NeuD/PglB/VioB family sugar acetyltransferase [Burkholderia pyrrocinia]|uniref:NeuD/PglB/VioB family sugar acetyltransferase n=1 Tax=Burkholderia pyrrocinia TaxID=60550 RepID=UPI00158D7A42|nr:NeuD/PglB/VioB family sugar acetyltransferase [Burkholderia pyrrocinia]